MPKPRTTRRAARAAALVSTIEVPGTDFRVVVSLDAVAHRHRATIGRGTDPFAVDLQDLDAGEVLGVIAALKAAEKEIWRLDFALPPRLICQRRGARPGVTHAHHA